MKTTIYINWAEKKVHTSKTAHLIKIDDRGREITNSSAMLEKYLKENFRTPAILFDYMENRGLEVDDIRNEFKNWAYERAKNEINTIWVPVEIEI